jgi:hypothetical protein
VRPLSSRGITRFVLVSATAASVAALVQCSNSPSHAGPAPDGGSHDGGASTGHDGGSHDGGASTGHDGGSVKLTGSVNKGPFVQGSSVDVYPIDSTGNPTGQDFPTITSDALGDFSVNLDYQGPVLLKGFGFYYDESAGALATSQLTLNALASVTSSGTQHAYINLVTHLTETREVSLLAGDGGPAFSGAIDQAESELRAALGPAGLGFNPGAKGSQLNLLNGDNDQSAYIFALSSVFEKAGGGAAGLQTLVNTTQAALANTGPISAATTAALAQAQRCVEPDGVMANLTSYMTTLGITPTPTTPNINRVLDSDLDGVPNLTDTCLLVPNPPATEGGAQPQLNAVCSYAADNVPVPYLADAPVVLLGDVDGQHGPDFVLVDHVTGAIDVRLNDGAGAFGASIPGSFGGNVTYFAAALADMNGDQKLDLVTSADGVADYFPGDGAGHFGAGVTLFVGLPSYGVPVLFQVVDLNGDHRPDFVFFTTAPFLGGGGGPFPVIAPASGPWPTAWSPLASYSQSDGGTLQATGYWVGDWTGDGRLDILVSDLYLGLAVYAGNGDGTFQAPTLLAAAGSSLQGIAGGDVDGDGKTDLVLSQGSTTIASNTTGKISVGFGDGHGAFAATTTIDLSAPSSVGCGGVYSGEALNPPVIADVTGDGKMDIYLGGSSSAQVIIGGSRTPTLAPPIFLGSAAPLAQFAPSLVTDVNGDGTADIVLADKSGLVVDLVNLPTTHSW